MMIDLFSDILARRENALTRVDARVKLLVALGAIGVLLFSTRPYLPLVLLALSLGTVLALRLPAGLLFRRLIAPLGTVLALVALKSLLTGSIPLCEVPLGPWRLSPTLDGAWEGFRVGLRVLGAASMVVLLGAVTPAHRIFHALRWMRFPETWVEIAVLMYRYTFALLAEVEDVAQAQRVRLGYATPRRAMTSAGELAGIVLVRSLDQSARTYDAMRLRLYEGRMRFAPLKPLGRSGWAALGLSLAALGALFVLLEKGLP